MVERDGARLDRVFGALADPTRRAILQRLADGPRNVGELSRPFAMSLAAVSKHLRTLERAGLIARERRGRERVCRLEADAMAEAHRWLAFYERFWNERLDALGRLLDERTRERDPMANEPISLTLTRRFRAPAGELYAAFTDPAIVARWMAPDDLTVAGCEIDARIGGAFMVDMVEPDGEHHVTRGVYREVEPGRRLVHTFRWDGSEVETLVTVELREVEPGVTELTFTHERFAEEHARDLHRSGWEGCLAKLARIHPSA